MKKRKLFISIVAGILAAIMVLTMIVSLLPGSQAATSSEIQNQIQDLQNQKSEIQAQMEALEQNLQENLSDVEAMVEQKNNIDSQITLLYQQMQNINDQISAYNLLIADKQDELDAAQLRYEELCERNKERIRAMEEDGELSYWSVLFQANSFADFLDRLNMIEEIAEADRQRLKEMSHAAALVRVSQEELEKEKAALEVTKAELEASQLTMQEKRAEADAILADLMALGQEFEELLMASQDKVSDLLSEIAKQEQAYNEAKQKEYEQWLSTSIPPETEPEVTEPEEEPEETEPEETEPEETQPEDPGPSTNSNGWLIPCNYVYVSSPFNPNRVHPIYGYARPHNGIDLAAYRYTPIVATRSGTVTTASVGYEAGNYVVVNHGDGFSSVYMHMENYVVSYGEYVNAGEVIGYVGSTGLSEGPHLHFGIMYNGTYVNPANYISFY